MFENVYLVKLDPNVLGSPSFHFKRYFIILHFQAKVYWIVQYISPIINLFLPFHVHDNNFVTIFTFFGIGFLFQMLVRTTSNVSNVWSNILTSSSHLTFSTGFFFALYLLFRKKAIKCDIKNRILQFSNLKCCIKAKEPFKTPL